MWSYLECCRVTCIFTDYKIMKSDNLFKVMTVNGCSFNGSLNRLLIYFIFRWMQETKPFSRDLQ